MNYFTTLQRKSYSFQHLLQVNIRHTFFRRFLNRIFSLTRPSPLPISNSLNPLLRKLRVDGLVELHDCFLATDLIRLKDTLMIRQCFDPWHTYSGKFLYSEAPANVNIAEIDSVETIPEALQIANNPTVLSIVSQYLRCKPTIEAIIAWWSFSRRVAPEEAQFFHRDNPSVRFLKLFIYLSDVLETSGPHIFAQGSHRSDLFLQRKRFSDHDIQSSILNDSLTSLTGPFGTAFLEDTYGIHKGMLPISSDRLIFQVTYSTLPSPSSFWNNTSANITQYDPYINRLMNHPAESRPRLYSPPT